MQILQHANIKFLDAYYWTRILGWITRMDYWTHIKLAEVPFQLLSIISDIHVHHILSLAY